MNSKGRFRLCGISDIPPSELILKNDRAHKKLHEVHDILEWICAEVKIFF